MMCTEIGLMARIKASLTLIQSEGEGKRKTEQQGWKGREGVELYKLG